jgi:hypothetical protein
MLGEILNNREATRKIAKWAIELSMYNIVCKPRIAIEAQTLSDFMAEWMETQPPPKIERLSIGPSTLMDPYSFKVQEYEYW